MSRARVIETLLVFLFSACLYVPFLSRHFDENGITEAVALDAGNLFSANHLLYRPLGVIAGTVVHAFGFDVRSMLILQVVTALGGAAAIAFAYVFFRGLTSDRFAAVIAALCLATTWAHWVWSTDAGYISVAAMFVAASLASMLGQTPVSALVSGGLLGFAVTTWQANVLLVPPFLAGWFLLNDDGGDARRRHAWHFLLACSLPICGLYLLAAIAVGIRTPIDFLLWVTSHASGAQLPMWGQFDSGRIPIAARTALRSITPFWTVGGVVALTGLLVPAAYKTRLPNRSSLWLLARTTAWLVGSYLVLVIFIVWWDPWATTWFVIPNIFLAGILALLVTQLRPRRSVGAVLVVALVASAVVNFQSTIWAKHSTPNPNLEMAGCVASHMQARDVFLATEWGWSGYLDYFFSRKQISVIDWAALLHDSDATMQAISQQVLEVQSRGGRAYIVDIGSYSKLQIDWVESQLNIRSIELKNLEGPTAFVCGGEVFKRVVEASDASYIPSERFRLSLSDTETRTGLKYSLSISGASDTGVSLRYRVDDGPVMQFFARLDPQGQVTFDVGDDTRKGLYRFVGFQFSGRIPWFAANAMLRVR